MIFTINSHTCFHFLLLPDHFPGCCPRARKKCIKSVETVERINANRHHCCCCSKMAQRNCFNESHFHIEQIIFVALDAPTQFSAPLFKESLELDIINYQVFTYQSILLKDVISRSFSHQFALKIFLGKKGKKVISSEIIQIKIFIQKMLPFTFLPCIIETNQGLERLCRFLFASSRVYTIESKLLTSCFLFRSFH